MTTTLEVASTTLDRRSLAVVPVSNLLPWLWPLKGPSGLLENGEACPCMVIFGPGQRWRWGGPRSGRRLSVVSSEAPQPRWACLHNPSGKGPPSLYRLQ